MCENLCNNQVKQDNTEFTRLNIQPKMNVILWKDKTKSNLADFHHGS